MNHLRAVAACLLFTAAALAADIPRIAPAEAAKLVAEGKAVLVDIREPREWAQSGVAEPAVLLPKSDFDGDQRQWKAFLAANRDQQLILYCGSGGRASVVGSILAEKGIKVANAGGLRDWSKAGLPLRKVNEKEK
jgi:rhodanese-related sulfurtransferase